MSLAVRKVDYLRISITDRCNERCLYCMPEGFRGWQERADILAYEEILAVVRAATKLGFRKFRVTGGEPLVRQGVVEFVGELVRVPGVEATGLSTNGTRLAPLARPLREAGLRTVNISLDALEPALYRRITGGEVASVLEGIRAAIAAGFERVKLNCVLMRGINESQIWPLVQFAAEHGLPLRFIELMPVSVTEVLNESNFLPVGEVMRSLCARDELQAAEPAGIGHGPARYYRLKKSGALVGFIGALTNLHFCDSCNKIRLTADGKIRPCLGCHGEHDLKPALREKGTEEAITAVLQEALEQKPLEHLFRSNYQPGRIMTAIGG